jgi:hypothetical protein
MLFSGQPSGGFTVDDAGATASKKTMGVTNGVSKETNTETVDGLFVEEAPQASNLFAKEPPQVAPQAARDQTAREKWMNDMFCEHTKDLTPAIPNDPANLSGLVTIPLDKVERLASEEPLSEDLKPVVECNLSADARYSTPVYSAAEGKHAGHLSSEGNPGAGGNFGGDGPSDAEEGHKSTIRWQDVMGCWSPDQ